MPRPSAPGREGERPATSSSLHCAGSETGCHSLSFVSLPPPGGLLSTVPQPPANDGETGNKWGPASPMLIPFNNFQLLIQFISHPGVRV